MTTLLPSRGAPEELVSRIRAYVTTVDPDLPRRWRGASDEESAAYATAALGDDPSALPASYLAFARQLGRSDGGLLANMRLETGIRTRLRYYEHAVRYDPESISSEVPVVSIYVVGDQLSLDRRSRAVDAPVAETSDGELVSPFAHNWESLVMQAAMVHVESHRLPHAHWFGSSGAAARPAANGADPIRAAHDALAEYAQQLELSAAWPSDAQHVIAISDARSVFATVGADGMVLANLFSRDGVFGHHEMTLAARLGARLSGRARVVDGRLQSVDR